MFTSLFMNLLKAFFIFLLFSLCNKVYAQEIEWQNTIGGSGQDVSHTIIQTSDGGYLLGGYSDSNISGDKTEDSNGGDDYWIVKTDSLGNIEWQNTIGGNAADQFHTVIQTGDGGYFLGGFSNSGISGDKTENCLGSYDIWVVKVDSLGNIQWENTLGGSDLDDIKAVLQTVDGGFLLGANSNSPISGDKTESSEGFLDYWIVKLDELGNIQWQNAIGGSSSDELSSITNTLDGGYILGGASTSGISGDKTENSIGGGDYWIVKIDSLGGIQWQNTIGGNSSDGLRSIYNTADSGYVLGGLSTSDISGDKTENCQGTLDYWIVKIDSTGDIQWQNTIGGDDQDFFNCIIQTNDGGYLICGETLSGLSGDKSEQSLGYYDCWNIKLDISGNIIWQNSIGSTEIEVFKSVVESNDGGYVFGGWSDSDIGNDKTENCLGSNDYWIVKITEDFNSIQGTTFADLNSNQQYEPNEPALGYRKITETNSNRFAFSQTSGFYNLSVLDTGNFEVASDYVNFYTSVPMVNSGNFTSIHQVDSLNDFAFQPILTFNDFCLDITPINPFRSGFNAIYSLNYYNQGTTTLIPTIVFYPDSNVSFVSASVASTTVAPDSVVFVLNSLMPFQSGQIFIEVSVDLGLPLGTLVNSGAIILPILNDANPGCNSSYWEVFTTGSIDPNDILVNRNFLYDNEIPNEPELEYIIRFQNTGNDTAFTVKVLNPIDTTRLQVSTLEIVSASHPASISWIPWERNMHFQLDNILLPDSNINEPLSHGFIRYKIKPKTNLLVGDSIKNMAAIYFDFNIPVFTNSAKTDIILFTGNNEIQNLSEKFIVYPNPSSSQIFIQFEPGLSEFKSLELYSIVGLKMQSIDISDLSENHFVKSIDISNLASGVYFIKLEGTSSVVKKFVKY